MQMLTVMGVASWGQDSASISFVAPLTRGSCFTPKKNQITIYWFEYIK